MVIVKIEQSPVHHISDATGNEPHPGQSNDESLDQR
jgi:hypothetical protein